MRSILTIALLFAAALRGQVPCREPGFVFPAVDATPAVRVWTTPASGAAPPSCAGWDPAGPSTVVRVAARFRFAGTADGLRRRIGAISATAGLLYWSTTDRKWQPLILGAWALTGPDGARRPDFEPGEIAAGRTVFFHQEDNRLGAATYRLRILDSSQTALAFNLGNVTPLKILGLQLFAPGEIQSSYSVQSETQGVWRYYAVARTLGKAGNLILGHESSVVNRAVALYRFMAGIPADRVPPAAP